MTKELKENITNILKEGTDNLKDVTSLDDIARIIRETREKIESKNV